MPKQQQPQPKGPSLEVKLENMHIYDIETNDSFLEMDLTDEQQAHIARENNKFNTGVIQPLLLSYCEPCRCRMAEITKKMQTRAKLIGGQISPYYTLDQADVDAYDFGLVVKQTNGIPESIEAVVVSCKKCKSVRIFGDADPIARSMATSIQSIINMQEALGMKNSDGSDAEFVMENLETGEREPADDLARALFGSLSGVASTAKAEDISLVDIPAAEKGKSHNKILDLSEHIGNRDQVDVEKNP